VLWRGEAAGALRGGKVRLYGELGHAAARERAVRRLEAFVAGESARRLAPLRRLENAMASGELKGLARGVTHRLMEAGGILDRRTVETDLRALSQHERRTLRSLGARIGAFSVYLPGLLTPEAIAHATALSDAPAARGLRPVGGHLVPVETLERLDELLRAGQMTLSDQAREELGWTSSQAASILRGLGFVPAKKGEPVVWRRRSPRKTETPVEAPVHSPFAALAALKPAPARKRRPRRRKARSA
jgi:ATP-dependent RNA helicase SUPV3L1/SUV3